MRLLEKYQNMDHSDVMYHPNLAHDIALMEKELKTAPESQDEFRQFLLNLLNAINQESDSIKTELSNHSNTMDMIEKNTAACLAYLKPKNTKGKL
jgi:hypothetical protein